MVGAVPPSWFRAILVMQRHRQVTFGVRRLSAIRQALSFRQESPK